MIILMIKASCLTDIEYKYAIFNVNKIQCKQNAVVVYNIYLKITIVN